jgi:response regulator RpfG family c-di-GMP phosphodiesterase
MHALEKDKISVLYVDDEVNNLSAFKASFRRFYTVFTAESATEGKKILNKNEIQVILTDQRMPNITGVEFLTNIIKTHPNPIRILVTGYTDINVIKDAINTGQIYKYVEKPWENDYLKMIIDKAFEVYILRKENQELTKQLIQANKQLEFMLRQKLIS